MKDNCKSIGRLLDSYVAEETSLADQQIVAAHLESCVDCRQSERLHRAALTALTSASPVACPNDLHYGFSRKLAERESHSLKRMGQLKWAAGTACLLLVITSGAAVVLNGNKRQPQPSIEVGPNQIHAAVPGDFKPGPVPIQEGQLPSQFNSNPQPIIVRTPVDTSSPNQGEPKGAGSRMAIRTKHEPWDGSFENVRDKSGLTLHDYRKAQNPAVVRLQPGTGIMTGHDARQLTFVPSYTQTVKLGDSVATVRGEAGWDADGKLSAIRVSTEMEKAAEPNLPGTVDQG